MKAICSVSGVIVPLSQAKIDLSLLEIQYNFGVYETLKVRNSIIYFLPQHLNRLFHSASCIDLLHPFTIEQISKFIAEFVEKLEEKSCNLKLLLYGSTDQKKAVIYIIASLPLYPSRKWYREGVSLMTFKHERWIPGAKTLDMLPSYYMYSRAKKHGHYDALLLDHNGNILEGTRTNVYAVKGKILFSSPKDKILEGVTMMTIEKIVRNSQFTIKYGLVPLESLDSFDGMIITSTSSKILPVRQVDEFRFDKISEAIIELCRLYDATLDRCQGNFNLL